jgi:transcription antitermination protein NusB
MGLFRESWPDVSIFAGIYKINLKEPFFNIMLNRRSLRVKVMQSLFALQQCKEANHELCIEKISEAFAPDLNSWEVQDKAALSAQKKEATEVFEAAFAQELRSVTHENALIQKAVNEALVFYF